MHILFITHEYPKPNVPHGGVGTVVHILAENLVKNNIQVSVVGINNEAKNESEIINGVNVFRLKKNQLKGITWIINANAINKKIKEIHQQNPIDIVEGTESSFAFINKIAGIVYLLRLHGGHHFFARAENRKIEWWKALQEKRSFAKADKIIGVSQYVVDHTSEYINFESKKEGVIFNPAFLERFYESNPEKVIANRLFFAGSLAEKKGIRQLIQAMPLIKDKVLNVQLVIAGRDTKVRNTNTSYLSILKKEVTPDIENCITFLGAIPNVTLPQEIEKSEVCVYPSHMEAMPLAWIEVMSMAKPFVASNLGPGHEVVKNNETGLLCNPLNINELAEKVIWMLENKEEAKQIGKNAREYALKFFKLEDIIQQNILFFQRIKQKN